MKTKKTILTTVALCGLLIWSVSYVGAETDSMPEPIAHWTFDEGTGDIVIDVSNNSNGTIKGDYEWVDGKIGGALSFDGGNYVAIANSPNLNTADDMASISLWVMFPDEGHNSKYQAIVRKWISRDGAFCSYTLHRAPGNKISASVQNKNVSQWPGWATLEGLSAHEWHHVVFTYKRDRDEDGSVGLDDGQIYIDGFRVSVGPNRSPYTNRFTIQSCNTTQCKLYIGRQFPSPWGRDNSANFVGFLDDLAIWDVALDDSAIQELYGAHGSRAPEVVIEDVMSPTGAAHAYDNAIWPPNNKLRSVTIEGYVKDELSIAKDGEGLGVSNAYLLIDGSEMVILRDEDVDLLASDGYFSVDIEVRATKGVEYIIELHAADTNSVDMGGPNEGLVDSTYIRVLHNMSNGKSGK